MRGSIWTIGRRIYKFIPYKQQALARYVIGIIAIPFYLGNNVSCPVCQWNFRRFAPAGISGRTNARCPRCGSLERTRSLLLYLQNSVRIESTTVKMLDVAPEPYLQKKLKAIPTCDHISLDLYSPDADVNGDVTNLPFEDATFDIILCNHVLEHVPADLQAMRELWRVCKPGGLAILQVPIDLNREITYEDMSITDPQERLLHFGQVDHVRVYGRDYPDRLAAAGFNVEIIPFATELGEDMVRRHVLSMEDIYIGKRM